MKGKTKRILSLLLSLCLLLGGVTMAFGEEDLSTETPAGQESEAQSERGNDSDHNSSHFAADDNNSTEVSVEGEKLNVSTGDVDEGGISIGVTADSGLSDIEVTVGGEEVDTGAAFDEEGNPKVNEVVVNAGDVKGDVEDAGIAVSSYNYDEAYKVNVTAGEVNVNGEDDTVGVRVYGYNGDVDISTADINVNSEGEAVGIDVTVEGNSNVDVVTDGYVSGDVGIRVQGTEVQDSVDNSQVNVVVTGFVSGEDVAIQTAENANVAVTAWEVQENDNGELAQVIDENGEVNKSASEIFEKTIQYIVKIAEDVKDKLSIKTDNSVTVGEEEYQTAAEGEDVTLRVDLKKGEEVKGIYYNDDYEEKAEYTRDGDNFIVKMLRGGAMLLGLDIGKTRPQPVEDDDDDDDHSSSSSSKNTDDNTPKADETQFIYVPVEDNVPVNGVTAAETPTVQETAHTVNTELNGGYRYVDIQNKIQVMNDEELSQFNELSIEDRILVMMVAMGLENTDGDFRSTMSEDAKALCATLDDDTVKISDEERAVYFPPRLITIDGVEYEAVGIVLIIDTNGEKSYVRYDFYNDNGAWKLYQIEEGKYITV